MSDAEESKAASSRRRWRRPVACSIFAALLLVVAAPTLCSWKPIRRLVLAVIPKQIDGTISAEHASFGWFSPPVLNGFEIRPKSGEPLIEVESVELDQPLWRLVSHPSDLGEIKVEHPRLHLLLREQGSNFEDAFGAPIRARQPDKQPPRERRPATIPRKMDLRIIDAAVVWRTPGASQEWTVDKINVALGLRPSWACESGSPEVVIQRGVVVDHCQLSPGMCDDVLKFVAPILSKVTRAQGEISIDLDDGRIPLDHLEQGKAGGRLALHNVEVGAGAFARSLAEVLHVPPNIAFARESTVQFELVDGRIHHRDLEFELPGAKIRTSGSVGFDRTLDLLAEVRLQLPETLTERSALARSLSEKTLQIPIGGTLARPKLEADFVRELGLANLFDKLEGLGLKLPGGGKGEAVDATGQAHPAGESEGKLLTDEAAALIEDLLRKWPQRRKARQEAAADAAAQGEGAQSPPSGSPPPKRRARERLRDLLLRPRDEAAP